MARGLLCEPTMRKIAVSLCLLAGGLAQAAKAPPVLTKGKVLIEIARLDIAHRQKIAESDALRAQIVARKNEIQQNWNRQRTFAIFGAFLGAPLAVATSLINMQNDDVRVRDLTQRLTLADAERARINTDLQHYQTMKAQLGYGSAVKP